MLPDLERLTEVLTASVSSSLLLFVDAAVAGNAAALVLAPEPGVRPDDTMLAS